MEDRARYVAVIMDGNARWARTCGLDVLEGHRAGAKALERTVRCAVEHEIRELTAYSFSTENWQRPAQEVEGLMALFAETIESQTPTLDEQGVRMRFIGSRQDMSPSLRKLMSWAEQVTERNRRMTLYVAFNYGGRSEIEAAAAAYATSIAAGEHRASERGVFQRYLYAPEMHDPDLLIRTSGEMRMSNFLLWQCAYSELFFIDVLWPDFDRQHLMAALDEYSIRRRRFGTRADGF